MNKVEEFFRTNKSQELFDNAISEKEFIECLNNLGYDELEFLVYAGRNGKHNIYDLGEDGGLYIFSYGELVIHDEQ